LGSMANTRPLHCWTNPIAKAPANMPQSIANGSSRSTDVSI